MSTYLDYDHEADETKRALGITVRSFAARTYRSLTSSQGVKVGDKYGYHNTNPELWQVGEVYPINLLQGTISLLSAIYRTDHVKGLDEVRWLRLFSPSPFAQGHLHVRSIDEKEYTRGVALEQQVREPGRTSGVGGEADARSQWLDWYAAADRVRASKAQQAHSQVAQRDLDLGLPLTR